VRDVRALCGAVLAGVRGVFVARRRLWVVLVHAHGALEQQWGLRWGECAAGADRAGTFEGQASVGVVL
jgi:hypothetical protein